MKATLLQHYWAITTGVRGRLRGDSNSPFISAVFFIALIFLSVFALTGIVPALPVDRLNTPQRSLIMGVGVIFLSMMQYATLEPWVMMASLRRSEPLRRMVGPSGTAIATRRITALSCIVALPISSIVLGTLGHLVRFPLVGTLAAINLSLVVTFAALFRAWDRTCRHDWRTISDEPYGADAVAEGLENYGLTVLAGGFIGVVGFLSLRPDPIPGQIAALALIVMIDILSVSRLFSRYQK